MLQITIWYSDVLRFLRHDQICVHVSCRWLCSKRQILTVVFSCLHVSNLACTLFMTCLTICNDSDHNLMLWYLRNSRDITRYMPMCHVHVSWHANRHILTAVHSCLHASNLACIFSLSCLMIWHRSDSDTMLKHLGTLEIWPDMHAYMLRYQANEWCHDNRQILTAVYIIQLLYVHASWHAWSPVMTQIQIWRQILAGMLRFCQILLRIGFSAAERLIWYNNDQISDDNSVSRHSDKHPMMQIQICRQTLARGPR